MNCRSAENHLFAERDGALDSTQRAALTEHVAHCATCRAQRDRLAAAIESWRAATQAVTPPDPLREWESLRRQIRGGVGWDRPVNRRTLLPWLTLPLGAAAAVALAVFVNSPAPSPETPRVARSEAVEVSAGDGSVVFVDDKSGWVVIWEG